MSTSTKSNAREAFVHFIQAKGWTVDTTATYVKTTYDRDERGNRKATETVVQEPFTYTRPAAHGGRWRIALDYKVRTTWSTNIGNTLRGVTVSHIASEERNEKGNLSVRAIGYLKPSRRYDTHWLAEVLPGATLRKQAEALAINPDLAVWVALERQAKARQRDQEATEARVADREERDQPLAVTVDQGHGGTWRTLCTTLREASLAVANADGKTDLPAALDALKAAVAAVDAVVIR